MSHTDSSYSHKSFSVDIPNPDVLPRGNDANIITNEKPFSIGKGRTTPQYKEGSEISKEKEQILNPSIQMPDPDMQNPNEFSAPINNNKKAQFRNENYNSYYNQSIKPNSQFKNNKNMPENSPFDMRNSGGYQNNKNNDYNNYDIPKASLGNSINSSIKKPNNEGFPIKASINNREINNNTNNSINHLNPNENLCNNNPRVVIAPIKASMITLIVIGVFALCSFIDFILNLYYNRVAGYTAMRIFVFFLNAVSIFFMLFMNFSEKFWMIFSCICCDPQNSFWTYILGGGMRVEIFAMLFIAFFDVFSLLFQIISFIILVALYNDIDNGGLVAFFFLVFACFVGYVVCKIREYLNYNGTNN